MNKTITIHCTNNNTRVEIETGSSLLDLLAKINLKEDQKIVNAKVNNKVESLTFRLYGNKTVEFLDTASESGRRAYFRSLSFILIKAASEVVPQAKLNIEHSISKGYFCRITNGISISTAEIAKIKAKMQEYIDADMPIEEIEEETTCVVEKFRKQGLNDKAVLLETQGSLYAKYYKLGDSINYFYGSVVPSTGYIHLFGLEAYNDGLLLRVPKANNANELEPVVKQDKMYNVFQEHLKFLDILGISNVGDLNRANQQNKMSDIIKVAEALQERSISDIAEQIAERAKQGVKVVLISGPSSSGKTTFRMRLEVQLRTRLLNPVGVSLDDYFVNRDQTPLDEHGEYDYESLYALDVPNFNRDLESLLKGEKVELPSYNFTTGKREYNDHNLQLTDNSIVIIEGIHGLNPELTASIPDNQKYLIYISALTTISLDDHNRIPTTDNRLLRRMIRDYSYRNYSPIDTISRWASVRRGEDKWIFPFQENADAMFNSAMIYEFAVLRPYAEPILRRVPNNVPEYAEAHRLLHFLSYFNFVNDKELPPTSLLREFVGGSSFKY